VAESVARERRRRPAAFRPILVIAFLCATVPAARAADVAALRQRWTELQAQDAALLAPKHHREARAAMAPLERGAEPARVATAEKKLAALEAAVQRARTGWSDLLRVRDAARAASAPERMPRDWRTAENVLLAAAEKLETGRRAAAERQAQEARGLYDAARLAALDAELLAETRAALATLERQEARKWAPRSYVRALDAAAAAEKLLRAHGDADQEARAAAARASIEARHASYLLERIRGTCVDEAPDRLESTVLDWEQGIARLLTVFGRDANFEAGLATGLQQAEQDAVAMRTERDRLRAGLESRGGAVDSLRSRLQELRDELRDRDLQIAALRRVQDEHDLLARIQGLFGRDEGKVLIDGRDFVLRLHGLQFASGKSDLPETATPLLDKVVEAVRLLPGARLVIEGHTDAQGRPETNLELSQRRADAVRAYLQEHARLEPARISALGHGAGRPVASNDTEEGRALNRRIEIVVARPN
jgi:outer membrane protein OmpA-like peptidoglycan-associated protein